MKQLLEAGGILKYIGVRELLTDCYIKCETGDIIGILGRNGSGKSTLLKIIFGTESAVNKSIRFNGRPYTHPYTAKKLVAYLPQHHFLPANLSVKRITELFIRNKEARRKVLTNERVQPHLYKRTGELSGGERRYLEILLLIHLDAAFILLDEPFSGIEPIYKTHIAGLLQASRPFKGFIITDHDYRNIIDNSTEILLITNGVCKHIQSLQELEDHQYLPAGALQELAQDVTRLTNKGPQ
jgi:ABC-type multidrug transport system ATPase subunit